MVLNSRGHKNCNSSDVFIEIICKSSSKHQERSQLHRPVYDYLKSLKECKLMNKVGSEEKTLPEDIEEIVVSHPHAIRDMKFEEINFIAYAVMEHAAEIETLENEDTDEVSAAHHWMLPNREFHGQWEHLYYEEGLKENILRFAKTIMLFAQKNIDPNAISCNKLVLLHGPPGTGKTSLCKAVAQKVAIHMNDKFRYTHLFEINSHSLFSKWFSESGKLVLKLFASIKEVAEDRNSLVIILIDEVESIAYARDSVSSNEPSDSLRVVNAVLTQLDHLRNHSNVLVLTTSNLTETIDLAFVDRADLKQHVGFPSTVAIFNIFKSAIDELIKATIVQKDESDGWTVRLSEIAKKCLGLSGRTLRKLPLLAHAWFINDDTVELDTYLNALNAAVDKHLSDSNAVKYKPAVQKA